MSVEIAWLGHATADIRMGGTRVLTDPLLRDRVAHLRRHNGTSVLGAHAFDSPVSGHSDPAATGRHGVSGDVDVVVISHLHHDHLDLPSIRQLGAGTVVVVPRGAARLVAGHAKGEIIEISSGEDIRVGQTLITAVPAEHHPGRFMSRVKAEPLGFVMEHEDGVVYFPGDTDLHPVMGDLPAPDVALLPIWGWGRTLGDKHLDPGRASQAASMLRARSVLPIHWGTFAPLGIRRRPPVWLSRSAEVFTESLARHSPETRLELKTPGPDLISF